ncbi:hypothetical protein BKA70DRAFT_1229891 [Coprinopsis sp. MPI-PUGE-AT-0042]|nr:hypothetical protein BKA70DRAFT_1229891 [Coprinopsis sp. MPI-PUGE-AT-0042]
MRWSDRDVEGEATPLPPPQWSTTEVTLTMPGYNCKRISGTNPAPKAAFGDSPPIMPIGDLDVGCIDAGFLTSTQLRSREDVLSGNLTNPNEADILSDARLDISWNSASAYICGTVNIILTYRGSEMSEEQPSFVDRMWLFVIVKGGEGDTANTFGYFGGVPINHEESTNSEHNQVAVVNIFRTPMHWAYGEPELLFQAYIANDGHSGTARLNGGAIKVQGLDENMGHGTQTTLQKV